MLRTSSSAALLFAAALALTACGGGDADTADGAATDPGSSEPGVVSLAGTDQLAYSTTDVSVDAGEVTIELACGDAVGHNVVLETGEELVAECDPGASDTGTVELEPGEYTFYCSVPGHRQAGMEGTLAVG